jgi:hypothetical protein
MSATGFPRWAAFGSGAGIAIRAHALEVAVARVRPSGVRVLESAAIERFDERPASEWGAQYAAILRRAEAGHLAATVVLPRREITVRALHLPGVAASDVAAAIGYQIDSLHPYPEAEAVWAWSRLGSSPYVLVAVARASTVERYTALFAEAGVRVASFTCSAAAIYSALRLAGDPPEGFVAFQESADGVEVYGESRARPVLSSLIGEDSPRARSLAEAELRLEGPVAVELPPLAAAAAICSAAPRHTLPLNLLPEAERSATSRWALAPTAALALILVAATGVLLAHDGYADRRYLAALEAEIARLAPVATRAAGGERAIERARARLALLDEFRSRAHADLNALQELTRLLPPPGWLQNMQMTRGAIVFQGEAEQAAALLKLIDGSPYFRDSEFTQPISRTGAGESFGIRANREGGRP